MARRFKAVVIDDLAWCRDLLTEVLRLRGYEVASYSRAESVPFCSAQGETCRSPSGCADLLLTDNRMPGLSGLQMLKSQRSRGCKLCQKHPALMSADLSAEERRTAKALGCQVFEKPFNFAHLTAWLEDCERSC